MKFWKNAENSAILKNNNIKDVRTSVKTNALKFEKFSHVNIKWLQLRVGPIADKERLSSFKK